MDLQVQTIPSGSTATTSLDITSTASPQKINLLSSLGPLSLVASFAPRQTLSSMALTSRSWRLAARGTQNFELIKELNLFYAALVKTLEKRVKTNEGSSPSAETKSMLRGLGLLESLISLNAQKELSLLPTLPDITHSPTAESLHRFGVSRAQNTLSQQLVGGCLDFLVNLQTSTLNTLKQALSEESSAPTIERRTDLLGCRLISDFNQAKDLLEICHTPFTSGLIELALRMKESSSGVFDSKISDAEWIQAELYRLAGCIENKTPITLECWQVFYRELFTKAFCPIRFNCIFDPELYDLPLGWSSYKELDVSLDTPLTPFLAALPPLLRDEALAFPCYTCPSRPHVEVNHLFLKNLFYSSESQQHLWMRFTICLKLLQRARMSPKELYQATEILVLDLLKYSRYLRTPQRSRSHPIPYQFAAPLNYLEEMMSKALNNLPNKEDRLKILCLFPNSLGNPRKAEQGPRQFLEALAYGIREITEEDVLMLRERFTRASLSVQPPQADAIDLDQSSL